MAAHDLSRFGLSDMTALSAGLMGLGEGAHSMEEVSRRTIESLLAVRPILHAEGATLIVLVTSPYHQRRAFQLAVRVLGPGVNVLNCPAQPSWWSPHLWWRAQGSRWVVFTEYLKLAYYTFFAKIGSEPGTTMGRSSSFGSAEATDAEILARSVLITFKPNEAVLDPAYDTNITAVVEEIGKMAGQFGNAYVVIEGNTDASKRGLVPADLVKELSYNRANAVKQALITKYNFNPNKFKVVGNGWDNPVPGMTDSSNMEHNRRNRRVEVKVFKLEGE